MNADLIVKHLPPSRDVARVKALDAIAQTWVEELLNSASVAACNASDCDACVASDLTSLEHVALRPGGRALFLLKDETRPLSALSDLLEQAGLIHILVEQVSSGWILARGELPPLDIDPQTRLARVASLGDELTLLSGEDLPRFVYLLVHQAPETRGWEQPELDVAITWDAITLHESSTSQMVLLGFSSLTKAVAFMQTAVIAGALVGINKLPRYRGTTVAEWHIPLLLNPKFESFKSTGFDFATEPLRIDPHLEDKLRE